MAAPTVILKVDQGLPGLLGIKIFKDLYSEPSNNPKFATHLWKARVVLTGSVWLDEM